MYGGSVPFPDEAEVLPGLPVTGTSEPMLGVAASNAKKRFGDTEAYRDKPFAVLFLLQALGVVAIAIANGVSVVRGAAGHPAGDPERVKGERSHQMLIMLVVASFVAAVLAACWLLLLRSGARALIWLGAIGGVVLALANGLWLLLQGGAAGIFLGVFSLLAGLMCLAFLVTNRHRVEFSAHLLARVASLTRLYPGTVYVAIGCAGVMLLWTLIWTAAVSYTSQMRNQATVLVLLMLSYLWMAQLLRAVVHTTVAGTVASDYFLSPHVPRDPTSRSLRRSLTTSFGSLCLGALVAAALKTARAAASAASKNGPDRFGLRSAALCVLGFLDVLTRFCNELAYTQVALYGKTFTRASRDTWTLLVHHSGVDALVQRELISTALTLSSLLSGLVCSLICGVWARATLGDDQPQWWQSLSAAFLIGYAAVSLVSVTVESGTNALFVCYAEDPRPLEANFPDLYALFISRPHVSQFLREQPMPPAASFEMAGGGDKKYHEFGALPKSGYALDPADLDL